MENQIICEFEFDFKKKTKETFLNDIFKKVRENKIEIIDFELYYFDSESSKEIGKSIVCKDLKKIKSDFLKLKKKIPFINFLAFSVNVQNKKFEIIIDYEEEKKIYVETKSKTPIIYDLLEVFNKLNYFSDLLSLTPKENLYLDGIGVSKKGKENYVGEFSISFNSKKNLIKIFNNFLENNKNTLSFNKNYKLKDDKIMESSLSFKFNKEVLNSNNYNYNFKFIFNNYLKTYELISFFFKFLKEEGISDFDLNILKINLDSELFKFNSKKLFYFGEDAKLVEKTTTYEKLLLNFKSFLNMKI